MAHANPGLRPGLSSAVPTGLDFETMEKREAAPICAPGDDHRVPRRNSNGPQAAWESLTAGEGSLVQRATPPVRPRVAAIVLWLSGTLPKSAAWAANYDWLRRSFDCLDLLE